MPAPLKEGDRIALLSPAGIIKPQFVYDAVTVLQEQGWEPYVTPNALGRWGTYSGTDEERYADLEAAILDEGTKAILCTRGGYGAVHLLDRLDKLPLRENAKWIAGFSDISALHALMHKHGIASIHSPMTKQLSRFKGRDDDAQALFDIWRGNSQTYKVTGHEWNRQGEAEGELTGGNLAVLAGLIGTPFDIIRADGILFIEDVSEPVYKTERIMYQLKLSGVLGRLKGLIVGKFTEYTPSIDNRTMEEMILEMTKEYDYPVAFNVPVGHVEHNLPLVESVRTRLTVGEESVTIEQFYDNSTITDQISQE